MFYTGAENLFDEMFNDFDDDFLEPRVSRRLLGRGSNHHELMKTDVVENDKSYDLKIDMPGYDKDDIKVKLDNGMLTVSAETSSEKTEHEDKNGKPRKNGRMIRQERYVGTISRSWYVGDDVDRSKISAKYENGVLCLEVPKAEPKKELPDDQKYIAIEG